MDPDLLGKCREYADAAVAADPSLTLVRGWYHDPIWGSREHWWTVRSDGTIHDPTAAQFPLGGIASFYEKYNGFFPCHGCDRVTTEETHYNGCCCYACFGSMVGIPVGGCRCDEEEGDDGAMLGTRT